MKRTLLSLLAVAALPPGAKLAPPARAEQVAALLGAADAAAADRTWRGPLRLRLAVDRLDALGAHAGPLADDPMPAWRAAAAGGNPGSQSWRGRVLGPAFWRTEVGAAAEFRIQQLFLGGRSAVVSAVASPAARLTVSVTDADRVEVCSVVRLGCRWMPLFTQRYTINVTNAGSRPARIYLVVD